MNVYLDLYRFLYQLHNISYMLCFYIYILLSENCDDFVRCVFLGRYYSVLYPLERKITDSKSRDLLIYMWVYAAAASLPVFGVTNVTDVYVSSSCSDDPAGSLGHVVYVLIYNVAAVVLPLAAVFLFMLLIRRALSASQKKKVIIAALRTPQSSISIPYVSQREAELHAALLAVVLAFSACSTPYGATVLYRSISADAEELPVSLYLTALWLPKVSLITNPLLFLTVHRAARHSCGALLARIHRRLSRRNTITTGGLASLEAEGGIGEAVGLEGEGRSGSQLLEMFNIGQQRIFRPCEEEEEDPSQRSARSSDPIESCDARPRPGSVKGAAATKKDPQHLKERPPAPRASPVHACAYASSSQVAPATPSEAEACTQVGFGPFELPPQWLPETRNSKKRLLPPLGTTPEELITINFPRPERKISRNNKVSSLPAVDP